ncbi:hypothetical protein A9Q95_08820 [Rhodobacterales bacterium 59_46_T64]|nr:hypothetical protein A9Q95_08820 [Rhodobacterales bacterium 59_46_T64]
MNLFIDANIFLDFYHLSGGDIEELKKLVALIEAKDIRLYSCKQLSEEIRRNREAKISDALREFQKASFKVNFPAFCKHYSEFEQIQMLLREANAKHSELLVKATSDIQESKLKADEIIRELFEKSTDIPFPPEIFNAAIARFRVGNPPGKKKVTVGDEINWETLLFGAANEEDLHFVSGDGDYASAITPDDLDSYLKSEWKEKKKSEIHFYKTITEFFKSNFPEIKLASDIKVNKLIERLAASGSFVTTHIVIGELAKQAQFSKVHVEELIEILDLNSQVGMIIGDDDLTEFYKSLNDRYADVVSEKSKETLEGFLFPMTEEIEDEEIPF